MTTLAFTLCSITETLTMKLMKIRVLKEYLVSPNCLRAHLRVHFLKSDLKKREDTCASSCMYFFFKYQFYCDRFHKTRTNANIGQLKAGGTEARQPAVKMSQPVQQPDILLLLHAVQMISGLSRQLCCYNGLETAAKYGCKETSN